ncbi:MAG: hypothetical protein COB45_10215 [Gammaproteobacteria bacterium]|nr:MAG: hypothetical protein COB45_10215 [Gammaproteobacteria bacterium]
MYKKILISLLALLLVFSASAFVWQTYNDTNPKSTNQQNNLLVSKVDLSWQQDSKVVDLDNYITANQISQEMKNKKHRLILKPELISFHAVLQTPVKATKAELVADTLGVWGISPLPEVAHSTYIRSLKGNVIAVYVENTIAEHLNTSFTPEMIIELQAYRLYNYAKGPRLLLVGVKTVDKALIKKLKLNNSNNASE